MPKNERSAALINLNDIFPTLCELTGVATPATVESKSLVPLLRHQTERIHDYVYGTFTDTQRMICDDRWKYVVYPKVGREQLFDLQSDPDERHDLSADAAHQAKRDDLKALLEKWRRENGDPNL